MRRRNTVIRTHWTFAVTIAAAVLGSGRAFAELPAAGVIDTDQPGSGFITTGSGGQLLGDAYAAAEWTATEGDQATMRLHASGTFPYVVVVDIDCGGQLVSEHANRGAGESVSVSASCEGLGPVTEFYGEIYLDDSVPPPSGGFGLQ
jgi:hypothetical protein